MSAEISNGSAPRTCPFQSPPAYPFRRDRARLLDPPPQIEILRREAPISKVRLWDGNEVWLVTRFDDVRRILRDDRVSSNAHHAHFPMWSAGVAKMKTTNTSFLRMDKPVHTYQKGLWQVFFAASNIAALRPSIEAFVDGGIDDLVAAGSPADLVKHLALSVPSHVISKLLDVPEEDRSFFQKVGVTRTSVKSSEKEVNEVLTALHDYWIKRIAERLARPGDDLVSRLIVDQVRTEKITPEQLADMTSLVLLAGFGTTADMIGLGTVMLLDRPAVAAKLRTQPSKTPGFIEELLRYMSIAQHGLPRVALEDLEIGGMHIRAGDGIVLHVAGANRDETVFEHPDVFDEDRQGKPHMAFGAGIHACIGAPLARVELQIVFDRLLHRLPNLRFATSIADVKFRTDALFFGVEELMVAWD